MAQRKRKSPSLIGIILFISFVIISGYILSYNGLIDNPFDNISFTEQQLSGRGVNFGVDAGADSISNSAGGSLELSASSIDSGNPPGALSLSASSLDSGSPESLELSASGVDDDAPGSLELSADSQPASSGSDLPVLSTGNLAQQIAPPAGFSAPAPTFQPSEGRGGRGGFDGLSAIQWSQIGDVLFDLWFIFAVTAVFIVFQQIYVFVARQIKRRRNPTSAAA